MTASATLPQNMISEGNIISVTWCSTLLKAKVSVIICFHLTVWSQPVCISVACCFINCEAFLLESKYVVALVSAITHQPIILNIRGVVLITYCT